MSATIYNTPEEFKVTMPNIFNDENYKELEDQWLLDLEDWVRDNFGVGKYIGRIIKFPVADSNALYMVKSLSPVELIQIPLMDNWAFQYAHLMTASEIKNKIDSTDKFENYLKTLKK